MTLTLQIVKAVFALPHPPATSTSTSTFTPHVHRSIQFNSIPSQFTRSLELRCTPLHTLFCRSSQDSDRLKGFLPLRKWKGSRVVYRGFQYWASRCWPCPSGNETKIHLPDDDTSTIFPLLCSTLSSSVFRRSLCPLPPSISFLDPTAEVDGQSACIWIGVQSRVVFSFFQRFLSNFELSPIIACRTGYDLELPNPRHLSTVHPPTPSPHHIVPI